MSAAGQLRSDRSPIHTQMRRRVLIENLEAYVFLFPAALLIFIFGLFPVAFAFFVSLHRWRRFPSDYVHLDNYARALGDFAFVFFFWLALGALAYGLWLLYRQWKRAPRGLIALLPALANAGALLLFIRWFALVLPLVLNIPQRIRGQERVQGLFVQELFASLAQPEAVAAANLMWAALSLAVLLSAAYGWWTRTRSAAERGGLLRMTAAVIFAACALLTFQLTWDAASLAVAEAQREGGALSLWMQVLLISLGALLIAAAWWAWRGALREHDGRRALFQASAALMIAAAGYLLVTQVPLALAQADTTMLRGYGITLMFVVGVVPLQLGIGLALAYMLFQNLKGKAFFRVAYFLPYIMPFAATSVVFNILFSHRPTSPANQLFTSLGLPLQKWLLEPTGVVELAFGVGVPAWLAGPSLALVVIILYSAWTYIGYCTVVFLAGLGNISPELYEAARIDGASGWDIFRLITLPLLSPTTFFLSLIAIIGTFQAFTQIWIMRTPAASSSVDTVGVYIFETVRSTDPNMGYASALSLVLFVIILIFTLLQNRLAGSKVFYG